MPAGTTVGQAAAAGAIAGLLFGLIAAGVESSRRSSAEKDVAPVLDALGDTKFQPALLSAIEQEIPRLSWTKINNIQTVNLEEAGGVEKLVSVSNATGLLTVSTTSFLSTDADKLVFAANAVLHSVPDSAAGEKPSRSKPVFHTNVSYEVAAPVEGKKREDFIPAWSANNGAAMKAAAEQATPKIAEMILRQLQIGTPEIEENQDGKFERRVTNAYGQDYREKVQVLETGSEGELVRSQNGALRFFANPVTVRANIESPANDVESPSNAIDSPVNDADNPIDADNPVDDLDSPANDNNIDDFDGDVAVVAE